MVEYRLLPAAKRDIEAIYEYTKDTWGATQARIYLTGLRRRLETLADFPKTAPVSSFSSEIRVALYEKHRILYRIIPEGIEVGLIPHQAQDIVPELERYASLLARKS